MKLENIIKLILSLIICQLAGVVGAVFTYTGLREWYLTLSKPSFIPPNAVFPLVWTSLFLLMGISLYLTIKDGYKSPKVKTGISLFSVQLLLNITWSFLFFGLRNPFISFIEIFVLWGFIFLTIRQFWKISKNSAYLLIPYIAWVSFAIILNYFMWILNM